MTVVNVRGKRIRFPDHMSKDEIQSVLQEKFPPQKMEPSIRKAAVKDRARSVLKGATMGFSDEIGAGIAAIPATVHQLATTGKTTPVENYKDIHSALDYEQKEYEKAHPIESTALEMGGAIATGGAIGAKTFPALVSRNMPKWAASGIPAAVEGAAYGFGTNHENRLKGAATGGLLGFGAGAVAPAVIEPVGGLLGSAGKAIGRKLTDTPKNAARRMLREVAESSGISPEEMASRYQQLGPEGTLADTSEAMRFATRGLLGHSGSMADDAKRFVDTRQLGSVDRMAGAVRSHIGSTDVSASIEAIRQARLDKAAPLYEKAYRRGIQRSKTLNDVLERPSVKAAMRKAENIARDEGFPPESEFTLLNRIHYAKMALDDKIGVALRGGKNNTARTLIKAKNDLLEEVDSAVPAYRDARDLYAGDTELLKAAERGKEFFKLNTRDFKEAIKGFSQSEMELFRQGAVQSILDRLESTQLTQDAAKKLVGSKEMRAKLGMLFPSEEDAASFLAQAAREMEFGRSRQVIGYGSYTDRNTASQDAMADAVNSTRSLLGAQDPIVAGLNILHRVIGKRPPTPEVVKEAGDILLRQGMSPDEIVAIFRQSGFDIPMSLHGALRGAVGVIPEPLLGDR